MMETKQQCWRERRWGQDESLVSDKEVQKSGLFKDEKVHVKVHRRVF